MIPVAEARARILASLTPVSAETIALDNALGRVLAAPVIAQLTQPPHDVSAMDGYAVRTADCAAVPCTLARGETIQAGALPSRLLRPGEAARIFTGAPLPAEADTIVIQEDTATLTDGRIEIREAPKAGQHIRRRGLDFERGRPLLPPGTLLTARHLALLAAAGIREVTVRRKPIVALIATGDELVLPGETPGPAQIVAASAVGLAAQIEAIGAVPQFIGIARDTADSLRETLARAYGADLIVTLGGASVGEYDLIRDVLGGEGLALDFWKIAMRPGKPLMFGSLHGSPFLGLPGNPVSSLVCSLLFLVPAVKALLGLGETAPRLIEARTAVALKANGPREDYMRARLSVPVAGGMPSITPFPLQDSAMLSVLAEADALLIRPIGSPAMPADTVVPALPLTASHILA